MSRRPSGQVTVDVLGDGTRAFRPRFRADGRRERLTLHERRDCDCWCGGGWTDRAALVELENVLARVRAGVWQKPVVGSRSDADRFGGAASTDDARSRRSTSTRPGGCRPRSTEDRP